MSTTARTGSLRRRLVVVAASTLAIGTLSAVVPTPAIVAASAATTLPVSVADQVAAIGTVSVIEAGLVAPKVRAVPKAVVPRAALPKSIVPQVAAPKAAAPKSVARVQVATVAPFRFGTVGYNQWWAKALMASRFGWTSPAQFQCLVTLWNRESHWNYKAHNGGSGAHGIPQALPGSKMRSAGSDWRTNPVTQILWGLGYVERRYSTPCGALSHFRSLGWY